MTEKDIVQSLDNIFKMILALFTVIIALFLLQLFILLTWNTSFQKSEAAPITTGDADPVWQAPDMLTIPASVNGDLIHYGRELIAHTAVYLGPKGKVKAISNGMNCQNCHLHAGTKPFGNNYARVASSYPKFRQRSGTVENFEKRINDCIQRSLNGLPLDEHSREMKAIVAYLKWIGKDVKKERPPKGTGLIKLPLLSRAADPSRGKAAYENYCSKCHGSAGEGLLDMNGHEWKYPPLWGKNSYNTGAGLYRISTFAAFIKSNMPYGISYDHPFLEDEQAWDIAAFVNSMPRPEKDLHSDWPDISKKPFDHPFGPYADPFSEQDHKYGPFRQIRQFYEHKN